MWFPLLFKYPRDAFDSGTLVFARLADPDLWISGAVLLCIAIAISAFLGLRLRQWSLWRRGTIALFQMAFALGVLALVAGPSLELTMMRTGANIVAVLTDTSASMGFPAAGQQGQTRLEAANEILNEELLSSLSPLVNIVRFSFDGSVSRVDGELTAKGNQTHLLAAVSSVISGFTSEPLAAVIVLSDGMDNGPGNAGTSHDSTTTVQIGGADTRVPVHTIGFGSLNLPGEVRLTNVIMPPEAAIGSVVTAEVTIAHDPQTSSTTILSVRNGQRLLETLSIALPEGQPDVRAEISFSSGNAGIHDLRFELTPPPGDTLAENNQIQRLLTVSERRRRVLYIEGEPRWEYKYLRRALAKDDVLALTSWLQTTDRKTYRQGVTRDDELENGIPSDPTSLYQFDVIILGSLPATELTSAQHAWLLDFVAVRGGSVLVLAGREALADGGWDVQPLADALPVAISRDSGSTYSALTAPAIVEPTPAGLRSELTRFSGDTNRDWQTLPSLGDLQKLGTLKPAATVLLELVDQSGRHPLLVTQPYGLGTTAVLATSTTWRWQMRTPPDDARHRLFWRQLIRQLAESARRQRDLKVDVDSSGALVIRATAIDVIGDDVRLTSRITGPDGSITSMNLREEETAGMYAGQHPSGAAGIYRVDVDFLIGDRLETRTRFAQVGAENIEFTNPGQNEILLRRLAETTGGRYWSPPDAGDIANHLRYASQGSRTIDYLPLWDMPLLLLILLGLKLSEWWLRRYWGQI